MTRHVENPERFAANIHEASVEITRLQNNLLAERETFSPLKDGHSITFKTIDPVNSLVLHLDLLMLQCFLIHTCLVDGRSGGTRHATGL